VNCYYSFVFVSLLLYTSFNHAHGEMTRPVVIDSRPSISSNRSQRREVDFENALLNPTQTLFISSSPNLDDDTPIFAQTTPGAPDPIEKRSFEQDFNGIGATPVKSVGLPAVIPPTPSTPGSNSRRDSMQSSDSAAKRLSKLKPLKALGMDGELQRVLQKLMSRGGGYR
jgi:hypothetical protein